MYWDDYEDMYPEPTGFMGATAHDFDDHRRCDPRVCPNAEQEGEDYDVEDGEVIITHYPGKIYLDPETGEFTGTAEQED